MDFKLDCIVKHKDQRGYLVEFLRNKELKKPDKKFGQIYLATFNNKGDIRGNHYHKDTEECFGVTSGSLLVVIEDINTKERKKFVLRYSENEFIRLRIGVNVAHAFKSLSKSAMIIDYANKPYNPSCSDRYKYILIK